jgi:ABC-type antimicrobial peptide transport system permease subunit
LRTFAYCRRGDEQIFEYAQLTTLLTALLAGIFAFVAMFLAAVGTYGAFAYAVSRRRREIGVRLALGALHRQVAGQFLLMGLWLLGTEILLGLRSG